MSDDTNSTDSGALRLFNITDDSSSNSSGESPPLLVNADEEWPDTGDDVLWEVDGKPYMWYRRRKKICVIPSDWEDEANHNLPFSSTIKGGFKFLRRKSSRKKKNRGEKEKMKCLTQTSSGRIHRRKAFGGGGALAPASTSSSMQYGAGSSEVETVSLSATVAVAEPPSDSLLNNWDQEDWDTEAQLHALPSVVASRKRKASSSLSADGWSEEEQELSPRVKKRSCGSRNVFQLKQGGTGAPNATIRNMSLSASGNSTENEMPGSASNSSMIVSLEEITRLLDTQLDLDHNGDDGFSEF